MSRKIKTLRDHTNGHLTPTCGCSCECVNPVPCPGDWCESCRKHIHAPSRDEIEAELENQDYLWIERIKAGLVGARKVA